MAIAWNSVNPNLFAAGYGRTTTNDGSLMIWDIRQEMNSYLNKVRDEESNLIGPGWRTNSVEAPREENQNIGTLGKVEVDKGPEIITDCKHSFSNISDDIHSISWVPDSQTEVVFATEKQI